MKNMFKYITLVFILLMSCVCVQAHSTQYLEDGVLKVIKGHSEMYRILLQNVDDDDKMNTIEISEESIAKIVGENNTFIITGKNDKEVFLEIIPPKDAIVGDKFSVSYKITDSYINNETGMIKVGSAFPKHFDVVVVSQGIPKYEGNISDVIAYTFIPFKHQILCTDPDNDTITYSINGSELNIDENGNIKWFPTKFWGLINTTVVCSDGFDQTRIPLSIDIKPWFATIPLLFILALLTISILMIRRHNNQQSYYEQEPEEQNDEQN